VIRFLSGSPTECIGERWERTANWLRDSLETFEKCSILFKFKEGENFNHRNTFSILRIKLKLHCVQNVEPDTEIGQKGAFCKDLKAC